MKKSPLHQLHFNSFIQILLLILKLTKVLNLLVWKVVNTLDLIG